MSALSLLAIVPIAATEHGRQMASAVAAAMADPAALLAQRSPGARAAGALTQTKQRRLASHHRGTREPFVPVERVLAGERRRPVTEPNIPGFIPAGDIPPLLADETPAAVDGIPPGFGSGGTGIVSAVPPVLAGGGAGGGGNAGGGGGGGGGTSGGGTQTPITAVPEPATWMLTLTGFAALAIALRRRAHRETRRRATQIRCDSSQR